jgi:hypothetical protein
LPGVIIGLVRSATVTPKDFLRWTVLDAGDALLELGDTVETMTCTYGSMSGQPGTVRFDALVWAEDADESFLGVAAADGVIEGWGLFTLGGQRSFERRNGAVPVQHTDDPFAGLPGFTVPGMKKVVFHGRRDDISVTDYRSIFRDHCPLTEVHMAHALHYWQREVESTGGTSALAADGVSEFLAATQEHIRDLYDSPESAAIVGADSSLFIDRATACTLFGISHVRLSDRPRPTA